MSLIFIFILLLIAVLGFALKMYRLSFAALGLNLIIFITVGSGFFPKILLDGLQTHQKLTSPEWKENNLIILLGSGAVKWSGHTPETKLKLSSHNLAYSRLHETARLYFDCKNHSTRCRILISGGDAAGLGTAEALIMSEELIEIGIMAADIIIESKSHNTFQNARFSSELIHKDSFDRLILVTSGTHMRRALLLFSYFHIQPIPAPSDHISVRTSSWKYLYHNFFTTDLALHEYVGYIKSQFSE